MLIIIWSSIWPRFTAEIDCGTLMRGVSVFVPLLTLDSRYPPGSVTITASLCTSSCKSSASGSIADPVMTIVRKDSRKPSAVTLMRYVPGGSAI